MSVDGWNTNKLITEEPPPPPHPMTNELLKSIKLAHSRYMTALEQKKNKLRKGKKGQKRLLSLRKRKKPWNPAKPGV